LITIALSVLCVVVFFNYKHKREEASLRASAFEERVMQDKDSLLLQYILRSWDSLKNHESLLRNDFPEVELCLMSDGKSLLREECQLNAHRDGELRFISISDQEKFSIVFRIRGAALLEAIQDIQ